MPPCFYEKIIFSHLYFLIQLHHVPCARSLRPFLIIIYCMNLIFSCQWGITTRSYSNVKKLQPEVGKRDVLFSRCRFSLSPHLQSVSQLPTGTWCFCDVFIFSKICFLIDSILLYVEYMYSFALIR